jgi:hypothetical protein
MKLDLIKTMVVTIIENVEQNHDQICELKLEFAQLQTQLSALAETAAKNTAEIGETKTDVAKNSKKIDQHSDEIDQNSTNIEALHRRQIYDRQTMGEMKDDFVEMKEQVDSLSKNALNEKVSVLKHEIVENEDKKQVINASAQQKKYRIQRQARIDSQVIDQEAENAVIHLEMINQTKAASIARIEKEIEAAQKSDE